MPTTASSTTAPPANCSSTPTATAPERRCCSLCLTATRCLRRATSSGSEQGDGYKQLSLILLLRLGEQGGGLLGFGFGAHPAGPLDPRRHLLPRLGRAQTALADILEGGSGGVAARLGGALKIEFMVGGH